MPRFDTHLMSAPLPFLAVAIFQELPVTVGAMCASVAGSVLPDVDTDRSLVGDLLPVTRFCKRYGIEIQHQGFFHSATFIGTLGIVAIPLPLLGYTPSYIALLLGVFFHQVLDSVISDPSPSGSYIRGIRWLAPFSENRFQFCPNPAFSFEYGSKQEAAVRWILFISMLLILVFNLATPRLVLNYFFADVRAGVEIIDEWHSRYSLSAVVTAKDRITNKTVQGIFPIEGVKDGWIILRSEDGLLSIGDGYDTDAVLRAESIRIHKTSPIRIVAYQIDMSGQPIKALNNYVSTKRKYRLFSPMLRLNESATLPIPSLFFSPVELSGLDLKLHLATLQDIQPVKDSIVEKGIVTVRYMLSPDESISMRRMLSSNYQATEIEDRAAVQVSVGQPIQKGDILAIHSKEKRDVLLLEQKKANLYLEMEDAQKTHVEQLEYFKKEEKALLLQIGHAKDIARSSSKLHESGGMPKLQSDAEKIDIDLLKSRLQRLYAEQSAAKTSHSSRLRALRLEIARSENGILDKKGKVYTRSLYSGVVKEVSFSHNEGKLTTRIEIAPFPEYR